jgi:pyridoxine 4-dehydrogenase
MAKLDARNSGTFKIGGDIEIYRLGSGAMRITGEGIWGPPEDRAEALRTLKRVPELGIDFIDSEELIREALYPYEAGFRRPSPGVWETDGGICARRQSGASASSASSRSGFGSCIA